MSMSLQAEGGSTFHPAGAVLFPLLRHQPAPQLLRPVYQPVVTRADARLDVPVSELNFRHLQTTEEIASIVHLRKEIQLVAAGVADPGFVAREKKETRRALSPLSSAAAISSGQSASFQ